MIIELTAANPELGKDIAMHIAASKPICVSEDQVSPETIEKEKDIFRAQAAESGKPADIIEKMVSGRISKFFAEVTLLGQPFIKDDKVTVGKLACPKAMLSWVLPALKWAKALRKKKKTLPKK